MFQAELKKFVTENPHLVSIRETSHAGLFVLKYKKRVFFDNLWNDYLEECRGTIVDADFNIVSQPFRKIYNYGIEDKAPVIPADTMAHAYAKINGFMAAMTWDDRVGLVISTTGSTDSPYVAMVRELMGADAARYAKTCRAFRNATFMFEACHTEDPHIIPEKQGLYLLGAREKLYGANIDHGCSQNSMNLFGLEPIVHIYQPMHMIEEIARTAKHEGFVLYADVDGQGVSTKIKTKHYLVQKWVARNPNTDKIMNDAFKMRVDEEFYPLIDHIRANIAEYTALDEQGRLAWIRQYWARK